MRCAIYGRYSSDMQRPQSIEDQIRECQRFASKQDGWVVEDGHIYTDHAVSGSDDRRTGYLEMREAARRREWDCLIVDDQSRLGRHALEVLSAIEELIGLGSRLVAVADGLDTASNTGKTTYLFKSVVNELFLDDLRERVRRGLRGQVQRGFSAGGRVYGYRYTSVMDATGQTDRFGNVRRLGVKIEVDPEQAETVRTIFEMAAKGHGLRTIAAHLNELRIPAPRHNRRLSSSGTWCTGTLGSLLRNPRYVGDWTYGKTRWVRVRGEGKKRRPMAQSSEKWTVCHKPELQIIERSLWDAVQSRGNSNVMRKANGHFAGSHTNSGPAKYLFSGLLKCGKCGASMIVVSSGTYSSYVCNNYWNRGKAVCDNGRRVPRRVIETDLLSSIQRKLLDDRIVDDLTKRVNRVLGELSKVIPSQNRPLRAEEDRLRTELDNLAGFVAGGDTSPVIREKLTQCEGQLSKVRSRLMTFGGPAGLPVSVDVGRVRARVASLRALFERHPDQTPAARRELAGLLVGKISLIPLDEGGKWIYSAEGSLKLGNIFSGCGFQDSEVALRGFEPRLSG